jgi:hypothetical protein
MMTHESALEASRLRIELASRRANLMGSLGELPKAQPLFPFRRRVISLPAAIELHHESEKARVRRRLRELAPGQLNERRAS